MHARAQCAFIFSYHSVSRSPDVSTYSSDPLQRTGKAHTSSSKQLYTELVDFQQITGIAG